MVSRLWQAVGTYQRLALSCGAAFLVAFGLDVYDTINDHVAAHRAGQRELAESQIALLKLQPIGPTIARDGSQIKALLAASALHPEVERIEWADMFGGHLVASGNPAALVAPVWFDRMIGLDGAHVQGPLTAGDVVYGAVALRESTSGRVNGIWQAVVEEAQIVSVVLAVLLGALLLIVRQSMRPLDALVQSVSRFGAGDFAARAAASGPREVASTIKAFNRMANQIESGIAALRASEQNNRHLAVIVEQTSEAILTRDLAGRITSWNPGAQRLFGYTADEAIGRTSRELHMRNLTDEQFDMMRGQVESGQVLTFEGERVTKSGQIITVEATVTPLVDGQGAVVGAIGIARDITQRRRMEQLLRSAHEELEKRVRERTAELAATTEAAHQASRAKSEFLANMSHEVRSPMNGVLGMLRMLLKSDLSARQRHVAQTAHNSGVALLKVLNDILDYSKIEAGKLELETIDFSLRDGVDDIMQHFALWAHDKGIDLACRIERDVPDALRGDPGRIRQVLSNLIGNALKFTDSGEVLLSVGVAQVEPRGIRLRFSVCDTGIGMDAQAQARLFEPFSQADASMTRRFGGTGLGLAVSRSLVMLMGGSIGVDSATGRGSTFSFTALLEVGQSTAAPGAAPHLAGLRVVAAAPTVTGREVLAHQLKLCGVAADIVASGAQALAQLEAAAEHAPYQVAILALSDDSGLRWARAIRDRNALDATRLVLINSFAADVTLLSSRELRIERVLNKPVSEKRLLCTLQELTHPTPGAAAQPERARFDARVLVVDDYVVNQEIARDMLEELGCRIDVAGDGRAAVAATKNNRYDLVFMDCQMPGMDGFQATAEIRQRETAGGPRLPIVALTAHAMRGDREQCLACGMDDYVSKPFESEQLQAVLLRWLPSLASHPPRPAVDEARPAASTLSTAVIDPAALAKLRAIRRPGGPSPVQRWLTSFLASTGQHLTAMQEAAGRDDAASLQRFAHTLKSGAAQFGRSGSRSAARLWKRRPRSAISQRRANCLPRCRPNMSPCGLHWSRNCRSPIPQDRRRTNQAPCPRSRPDRTRSSRPKLPT